MKMLGQRVDADPTTFRTGDYGRHSSGGWYARVPGRAGLANLSNHEIVEHDNGAITVSPSILVTGHEGGEVVQWHGYLRMGWWEWDENA